MNPFLCDEDWLRIDWNLFAGQKASYIWFSAPKEEDFRVFFFDMSNTKAPSMSWAVHTSGAGWAAAMPKEVLHQDIDPGLNLKFKAQWGPGCSA